jgi:REP element-mobilizing transposase RayT
MDDYESLSHTKWECKYHVVFMSYHNRNVPVLSTVEVSPC